ncbi:hypothetical protein FPOAC1_004347 [Fusarium poae]|uniref:hypothetical protein n=1 Tax=Fusarium poae TaxID=36050 RepID=UPI001CE73D8D|nr:hypothetical protein FPOAC1_004347 [Fusarium poae]KAG8671109.1 hypothetical protein FPOAC1_004347 [Fusarium poae]
MTAQTFTCFGQLPPELRIKIYLLATPPRAVTLKLSMTTSCEWEREYKEKNGAWPNSFQLEQWNKINDYYFRSCTTIPALLHTCRESRGELINHGYELTFTTVTRGPRVWFNYRQDAIYVPLFSWSCVGSCTCPLTCYFTRSFIAGTYRPYSPNDLMRIRWVLQESDLSVYNYTGDAIDRDGNPTPFLAADRVPCWK